MRTTIDLIKNDKSFDLSFTLQDYSGVAVNLTGATLKLKAQKKGDAELAVNGTMTVDVAASGTCHYGVAVNDFDEAGIYNAEIEATYSSGQVITFTDIIIKVKSDLPE